MSGLIYEQQEIKDLNGLKEACNEILGMPNQINDTSVLIRVKELISNIQAVFHYDEDAFQVLTSQSTKLDFWNLSTIQGQDNEILNLVLREYKQVYKMRLHNYNIFSLEVRDILNHEIGNLLSNLRISIGITDKLNGNEPDREVDLTLIKINIGFISNLIRIFKNPFTDQIQGFVNLSDVIEGISQSFSNSGFQIVLNTQLLPSVRNINLNIGVTSLFFLNLGIHEILRNVAKHGGSAVEIIIKTDDKGLTLCLQNEVSEALEKYSTRKGLGYLERIFQNKYSSGVINGKTYYVTLGPFIPVSEF